MKTLTRCILCGVLSCGALRAAQAQGPDPFASNNTVYPAAKDWEQKQFRTSNYDYPVRPIVSNWARMRPAIPALTKATAPAYVAAVKKFIEHDMNGLINDPLHWSPRQAGWYDMPCRSDGPLRFHHGAGQNEASAGTAEAGAGGET